MTTIYFKRPDQRQKKTATLSTIVFSKAGYMLICGPGPANRIELAADSKGDLAAELRRLANELDTVQHE